MDSRLYRTWADLGGSPSFVHQERVPQSQPPPPEFWNTTLSTRISVSPAAVWKQMQADCAPTGAHTTRVYSTNVGVVGIRMKMVSPAGGEGKVAVGGGEQEAGTQTCCGNHRLRTGIVLPS